MLFEDEKNAINFHWKYDLNDYDFVPCGNFFTHFINSGHDMANKIYCTPVPSDSGF